MQNSSLADCFFAAVGHTYAQEQSPQLDVIGLKLGMTVAQAKARLQEFKPSIWIVTRYATDDRNTWGGIGMSPQFDAGMDTYNPFHSAAIHIPVHLDAGYIDHACAQKGGAFAKLTAIKPIIDQDTPVDQFSGEVFSLSFTSTDGGGKLSAIIRQEALTFYAASNVALPKKVALEKGAIEKYGSPSTTGSDQWVSTNLYWLYNRNGGKLSGDIGDACESRFADEDGCIMGADRH